MTDRGDDADAEDGEDGRGEAAEPNDGAEASGQDGGAETSGTFVVTDADETAPVVRDVRTAQVLTLSSAPEPPLEEGEVLEATLVPEPPLEVTWELREVETRRTIEVVDSDLEPTRRSLETAADLAAGDLSRIERAGTGEVHVLSVPEGVDGAAREVREDPETVARAARLEAVRVEVRRSREEGVVSVRYLPD